MKTFRIILASSLLVLALITITPRANAAPINELEVVMFTRNACVHCATMKAKLSALQRNGFPQIKLVEYEVFEKPENQQLFEQYSRVFGFTVSGVPVTIIGNEFIDGEDTSRLEALINACKQKTCPPPTELIKNIDTINTPMTTNNTTATTVGWFIIGMLGAAIVGYIIFKIIRKRS